MYNWPSLASDCGYLGKAQGAIMAYERQIEAAKAHFGKVLQEQLARVETLKKQPDCRV